jgi:hypothetical protein
VGYIRTPEVVLVVERDVVVETTELETTVVELNREVAKEVPGLVDGPEPLPEDSIEDVDGWDDDAGREVEDVVGRGEDGARDGDWVVEVAMLDEEADWEVTGLVVGDETSVVWLVLDPEGRGGGCEEVSGLATVVVEAVEVIDELSPFPNDISGEYGLFTMMAAWAKGLPPRLIGPISYLREHDLLATSCVCQLTSGADAPKLTISYSTATHTLPSLPGGAESHCSMQSDRSAASTTLKVNPGRSVSQRMK